MSVPLFICNYPPLYCPVWGWIRLNLWNWLDFIMHLYIMMTRPHSGVLLIWSALSLIYLGVLPLLMLPLLVYDWVMRMNDWVNKKTHESGGLLWRNWTVTKRIYLIRIWPTQGFSVLCSTNWATKPINWIIKFITILKYGLSYFLQAMID